MKQHIDFFTDLILKKRKGGGGDITIEALSVTANGSYVAPSGKAFSPVSVAVPVPELDTLNVSENGSYSAPSGHAYDEVVVACPEPKQEDTLNVSQNGQYTPQSGHVYSEVNVACPVPPELDTLNVSQNGSYSAPSGHAYDEVVVACPEPKTEDTLNVSQNGQYTPSQGHVYSEVNVACPVPPTLDTLNVSQNGQYNAPSGHAYDEVVVACPEPKTEDTLNVSQNGQYTPSQGHVYSEVNVNVDLQDVPRKDVNFFSYDGRRIASYTRAEVQAMTELPAVPSVQGLVNGEWNWTLAQLKAHNGKANVGAYYDNAGDISEFTVEVKYAIDMKFHVEAVTGYGTAYIDWGDGSERTMITATGAYNHTYQPGTYTLSVKATTFTLGLITPGSVVTTVRFAAGHTYSYSYVTYYGFRSVIGGGSSITGLPDRVAFYVFHKDVATVSDIPASAVHLCFGGGVTAIPTAYSKYQNVSALKEIYVPAVSGCPIVYYNNKAFGIWGLEDIYIPTASYGSNAFYNCKSLGDIIIPEGVTTIGSYAFSGAERITSVDLPSTLTSLDGFSTNHSNTCLRTVIFRGTTPPTVVSSTVFAALKGTNTTGAKILVPQASLSAYQNTTNLTQFADIMEGY